jgi:hypothetical protein
MSGLIYNEMEHVHHMICLFRSPILKVDMGLSGTDIDHMLPTLTIAIFTKGKKNNNFRIVMAK